MFTGSYDPVSDLTDSRWTRDMMHKNIVKYEEVEASHLTFMVGKDMTYWTHDVMNLLQHYQPLPKREQPPRQLQSLLQP